MIEIDFRGAIKKSKIVSAIEKKYPALSGRIEVKIDENGRNFVRIDENLVNRQELRKIIESLIVPVEQPEKEVVEVVEDIEEEIVEAIKTIQPEEKEMAENYQMPKEIEPLMAAFRIMLQPEFAKMNEKIDKALALVGEQGNASLQIRQQLEAVKKQLDGHGKALGEISTARNAAAEALKVKD